VTAGRGLCKYTRVACGGLRYPAHACDACGRLSPCPGVSQGNRMRAPGPPRAFGKAPGCRSKWVERWGGSGAGGVPGASGAHGSAEWAPLLAPRCFMAQVDARGTRVEPCVKATRCRSIVLSLVQLQRCATY
jgi:hypothetical protein